MGVIPLSDIQGRLPQAGRIRLGEKGGRQGRRAIDRFRFTAPVAETLEKLATLYGGEVKPWNESRSSDKFQLYSEASEIKVVLPPDALDASYELWSGGGRSRRCDGVMCEVSVPTDDGVDLVSRPCYCASAGERECDIKLRLSVILPEVRGLGLWRLDTGSEHALREMPGTVRALGQLDQGQGMMRAVLRVEQRTVVRTTKKGPRTQRFNVPVLDFANSFDEIVSGEAKAQIARGASPSPPVAGADRALPPSSGPPPSLDDEIVEAEVIEDPLEEVVEWSESLDARTRNNILTLARQAAAAAGEPIPTTFAAISGQTLAAVKRGLASEGA